MTLFVVTGGTGFIGRHLIASLVADGMRVKALTRQLPSAGSAPAAVEWVLGDAADAEIWRRLLEKNCTLINLAFSNIVATASAIATTEKMIEACAEGKVGHLIHCSTVSVYGRARESVLTEESACHPADSYGQIKLRIEQTLTEKVNDRFALTILRPSTVFGEGGDALMKLVTDLVYGRRLRSYLKSSLFSRRRTYLIPVETVVAAIRFVASRPESSRPSTFIVSDDEEPLNNFRDVEHIIMDELGLRPYPVPPLPLPKSLLEGLMKILGRSNANTQTIYRSDKLAALGFVKPLRLEAALRRFAGGWKETPQGYRR